MKKLLYCENKGNTSNYYSPMSFDLRYYRFPFSDAELTGIDGLRLICKI